MAATCLCKMLQPCSRVRGKASKEIGLTGPRYVNRSQAKAYLVFSDPSLHPLYIYIFTTIYLSLRATLLLALNRNTYQTLTANDNSHHQHGCQTCDFGR